MHLVLSFQLRCIHIHERTPHVYTRRWYTHTCHSPKSREATEYMYVIGTGRKTCITRIDSWHTDTHTNTNIRIIYSCFFIERLFLLTRVRNTHNSLYEDKNNNYYRTKLRENDEEDRAETKYLSSSTRRRKYAKIYIYLYIPVRKEKKNVIIKSVRDSWLYR